MEYAIDVHDICKEIAGNRILDSISFSVLPGQIVGILGNNGAGKTTLFKLLLGLLHADRGGGTIFGLDIEKESQLIREKSGVVLDNHGLYEYLTAFENLQFYGRIYHLSSEDYFSRIKDLAEKFQLVDQLDYYIHSLSKGMKQKVAIMRSILHKPKLLFLDEPTDGLDPLSVVILRNELKDLASNNASTILINTHNLREAELLCDLIITLKDGKLISKHFNNAFTGIERIVIKLNSNEKLNQILNTKQNCQFFNENEIIINEKKDLNNIIEIIINHGGYILDISNESTSIEDTFLKEIVSI